MKKANVLIILLLALSIQLSAGLLFAANVKIVGRQLFVDGKPFTVKGVNYGYTPVGQGYQTYDWTLHPEFYKKDFALIKAMGANTIRIYNTSDLAAGLGAVLDAASEYGLYAILSIDVSWTDNLATAASRKIVLDEVTRVVTEWKDHPAVLMWVVGLEINQFNKATAMASWYNLLDECAQTAHALEGSNYHPVTTAEAEITEIGLSSIASDDNSLPNLDLWSADVYRGSGEGSTFSEYLSKSNKPLILLEFGCDAWDDVNSKENQTEQALSYQSQWSAIDSNLSAADSTKVCAGAVAFQWCDDWSKNQWGSANAVHDTTPIKNWSATGYYDYAAGDNINEEWWGIAAISPNTDDKTLRTAYQTIKGLWGENTVATASLSRSFQTDITNYPNPFKPGETTTIEFSVAPQTSVIVKIYDIMGNLVKVLSSGTASDTYTEFKVQWDGRGSDNKTVANGVYICYVEANGPNKTEVKYRKILALK